MWRSLLDVILKIVQIIFNVLFGALSSFLCYSEFPSKKSFGGKYDLIESCVFFYHKNNSFHKTKIAVHGSWYDAHKQYTRIL